MIQSIFTSMPMFVCAFWTAMLASSWQPNGDRAKRVLCIFMFVATLLYLGHGFYFYRDIDALPVSDAMYTFCNLAVFPLYYIYTEELTDGKGRWRKRVLYLLPAILTSTVVAFLYIRMNRDESILFIENYLYHNESVALSENGHIQASLHTVAKVIFAIQIIPVLWFGIRKINRFNQQVSGYYADTDDKTLSHFKYLLILFLAISLISFVCNIIGRYYFADSIALLALPSLTFSILLYIVGYMGYGQHFNAVNLETEMNGQSLSERPETEANLPDDREDESGCTLSRREQTNQRIVGAIKDEKLFLRPNLKISDVAGFLHTNRDYIYHAINVEMGVSFSDFINQQRVEYAQQLMKDYPDKLLYEVATESGFSSNVTFYRCFKQFAGCSPKEYKENLN